MIFAAETSTSMGATSGGIIFILAVILILSGSGNGRGR